MKHCAKGLLSMVNFRKDGNGSQFYIHMNANRFLDGSNVVFGQSFLTISVISLIFFTGEVLDSASMVVLHKVEQLVSCHNAIINLDTNQSQEIEMQ